MENQGSAGSKDMLYLVGGLALLVAGVGLIMAHPEVRRQLRSSLDRFLPRLSENLGNNLAGVVPDVQRYLKLRSM